LNVTYQGQRVRQLTAGRAHIAFVVVTPTLTGKPALLMLSLLLHLLLLLLMWFFYLNNTPAPTQPS
jgi:hypothetical protein